MAHDGMSTQCLECGVEHLWLLRLCDMVRVVNFECNECGHQQTRILAEAE